MSLLQGIGAAVGPFAQGLAQQVGVSPASAAAASAAGAAGPTLVDIREAVGTAGADSTGTGTVVLDQVPAGCLWRVTRVIVVNSSTGAVPACVLYDGASEGDCLPQNALDGTADGLLDISDVAFYVQSSRSLIARWTGADPGSACFIRLQYELLAR